MAVRVGWHRRSHLETALHHVVGTTRSVITSGWGRLTAGVAGY
jgi:hypothetical protein